MNKNLDTRFAACSSQQLMALGARRIAPRGQAITEMVFVLPLLVALAAGALGVGYMCWEGVKVQQAANLAARIEGQQRVGGGPSPEDIQQVNGLDSPGDEDIGTSQYRYEIKRDSHHQRRPIRHAPRTDSVYGAFYNAVRNMFGSSEQDKLSIPPPHLGGYTDQVKVQRQWDPPQVLSSQIPPTVLEGSAYGGECPNMYALPCWGHVGNNRTQLFYQQNVTNPHND